MNIDESKYYIRLWDNKKLLNFLLNIISYYLSKSLKKYYIWGKPSTFFIEPTNICNLHCTECPVGLGILERPQGFMDFDNYKKIINQISDFAWYILLYFQGESMIHPDIIDMIDYAYKRKMYIELSTNGSQLSDKNIAKKIVNSNLSKLVISLDGASDEIYKIYRKNGSFNQVVKGITNVVTERKSLQKRHPRINIQFLVMKHNEHQIQLIKDLGKQLGVDSIIFKSPQIYDVAKAEEMMPNNPKFQRYFKQNGSYKLKGSFSGYCKKLWIGSVITQDFQTIPCCFDKDANYSFGVLNSDKFIDIWNSINYHTFRKKVIERRNQINICQNCSEGLKTLSK